MIMGLIEVMECDVMIQQGMAGVHFHDPSYSFRHIYCEVNTGGRLWMLGLKVL